MVNKPLLQNKLTLRLENRLRREIQLYLNHTLIPSLRSRKQIPKESFNNIITQYSNASYRIGAYYTSKIANRELLSSEEDNKIKTNLVNYFTGRFWDKIDGLSMIQRLDPKLRPSQLVSMEKDNISSEMSTLVAWKSFNSGIKNKGIELKDNLSSVNRNGLIGTTRRIWNKDFTGIYKQRLITDRILNSERTSQSKDEASMSFVFVTQNDEKVCEICRDLELRSWKAGDVDMPDIPDDTHPNCRCSLILAETEEEMEGRISSMKDVFALGLGFNAADLAIASAILAEEEEMQLDELLLKISKKREQLRKKKQRKTR